MVSVDHALGSTHDFNPPPPQGGQFRSNLSAPFYLMPKTMLLVIWVICPWQCSIASSELWPISVENINQTHVARSKDKAVR